MGEYKIYKNENNISISYREKSNIGLAETSFIERTKTPDGNLKDLHYFNRINVPNVLRKKGIGNNLLKSLLDIAKEMNIAILCHVNAYGDMNYEELTQWYMKNGFKKYINKYGSYDLWFNS